MSTKFENQLSNRADEQDNFNPYTAPTASMEMDDEVLEYDDSPFYARSGRIGRLRFLAYTVVLGLLLGLVAGILMGILVAIGGESMAIFAGALLVIITLYAQIVPAIRRFNDLGRSGWWSLLMLVPYLNIVVALYLMFAAGDDGYNDYGAPAYPPSTRVKIAAFIFPVIALVGILAAIALPAYQDYVERAKVTQQAP